MKCGSCNYAKVEATTITLSEWDGDDLVVIEDVPVEKCPRCGEEYFAPSVLRELEGLMAKRDSEPSWNPIKLIQVPVFKYALAS